MRLFRLPDDERARFLIVGGWNVVFGYGLFLVLLTIFAGPVHTLSTSPTLLLNFLGNYYYVLASWICWGLAVPLDALAMQRFAYLGPGRTGAQIGRAYFIYLPAQVLGTLLLWICARFVGLVPAVAALAVIAMAAVLSCLGHQLLAFRLPLVVGDVPPEDFLRDHSALETVRALLRHVGHAVLGLVRDVGHLPPSLALARRKGVRPYVFAGLAYHHASAGIRSWHRLIHEMNGRGMIAYSLRDANPAWDERTITHFGYWMMRMFLDPIVVYPEVVSGNPLRSKHVVRYVMNTPGHLGGDTSYADTELVFTWSRRYYDTGRVLMIDTVERELFNSTDLPEKDTDCAYLGKAEFRGVEELPQTFDMVHITRFPHWPSTRKELADLLRRTRVLYTYDDCTMIIDEALLCGCEVILLPEGRQLTDADTGGHLTQQEYEDQLTRFIEETQRAWQP